MSFFPLSSLLVNPVRLSKAPGATDTDRSPLNGRHCGTRGGGGGEILLLGCLLGLGERGLDLVPETLRK